MPALHPRCFRSQLPCARPGGLWDWGASIEFVLGYRFSVTWGLFICILIKNVGCVVTCVVVVCGLGVLRPIVQVSEQEVFVRNNLRTQWELFQEAIVESEGMLKKSKATMQKTLKEDLSSFVTQVADSRSRTLFVPLLSLVVEPSSIVAVLRACCQYVVCSSRGCAWTAHDVSVCVDTASSCVLLQIR